MAHIICNMKIIEFQTSKYVLGNVLGRGLYSTVYKAMEVETEEMVAVKRFHISKLNSSKVSNIITEVKLLKEIDHENVVKLMGFSKTPHHLNILLEYVEGGSILDVLENVGVFPEDVSAFLVKQILLSLNYLHSLKIIHQDIKSGNVLITKNGVTKLSDFGISRKSDLKEKDYEGSPFWMAPEVIEMKEDITTAADIWSLGCLVIELVSGSPPYSDLNPMGAVFRMVNDDFPPLPSYISSQLRDFLLACFRKETSERPTAEQLLNHSWIRNCTCESMTFFDIREKVGSHSSRMSLMYPDRIPLIEKYERPNNLVFAGYLLQQEPVSKAWERIWLELHSDFNNISLICFHDEKSQKGFNKFAIDESFTCIPGEGDDDVQHLITLSRTDEKETFLYLGTNSEREFEDWNICFTKHRKNSMAPSCEHVRKPSVTGWFHPEKSLPNTGLAVVITGFSTVRKEKSKSFFSTYRIQIYDGKDEWKLYKRYSEFVTFDKNLKRELEPKIREAVPSLPSKKLFGRLKPEFVRVRRGLLEDYLNTLMDVGGLECTEAFRTFFYQK